MLCTGMLIVGNLLYGMVSVLFSRNTYMCYHVNSCVSVEAPRLLVLLYIFFFTGKSFEGLLCMLLCAVSVPAAAAAVVEFTYKQPSGVSSVSEE